MGSGRRRIPPVFSRLAAIRAQKPSGQHGKVVLQIKMHRKATGRIRMGLLPAKFDQLFSRPVRIRVFHSASVLYPTPDKYRYSKTPASITNAVASTISSAIFRDFFTLISLLEQPLRSQAAAQRAVSFARQLHGSSAAGIRMPLRMLEYSQRNHSPVEAFWRSFMGRGESAPAVLRNTRR